MTEENEEAVMVDSVTLEEIRMRGAVSETVESAEMETLVRVSVPDSAEMNGQVSTFSVLKTNSSAVNETDVLTWKTYDVSTVSISLVTPDCPVTSKATASDVPVASAE